MDYRNDFRVLSFALTSRIFIFILQLIFNLLVPDHNADAFRTSKPKENLPLDFVIDFLFSGFSRWDAQYFIHVAQFGYTYENTLAFFPLFPYLVRGLDYIVQFLISDFCSLYFRLLAIGVLLNAFLFVISAIVLSRLTYVVTKSKELSLISAFLYCINPASIFFAACYSEVLFFMLTLFGLFCLENHSIKLSAVFLGLSTCTRSNGLVSVGFVLHAMCKKFLWHTWPKSVALCKFITVVIPFLIGLLNISFLCILPFVCFQIFGFLLYCTTFFSKTISIPPEVELYGKQNGYVLPSENNSVWCYSKLPFPYTYVQEHYWNVGFLCYFEWKQIPNFLLAFPILIVIMRSTLRYLRRNGEVCWTLGLGKKKSKYLADLYQNENVFVYFVHASFLALFSAFFMHVQVATRLLASSTPLLYWIISSAILADTKDFFKYSKPGDKYSVSGDIQLLLRLIWNADVQGKLYGAYFLLYFFTGTIIHVNYLPWT